MTQCTNVRSQLVRLTSLKGPLVSGVVERDVAFDLSAELNRSACGSIVLITRHPHERITQIRRCCPTSARELLVATVQLTVVAAVEPQRVLGCPPRISRLRSQLQAGRINEARYIELAANVDCTTNTYATSDNQSAGSGARRYCRVSDCQTCTRSIGEVSRGTKRAAVVELHLRVRARRGAASATAYFGCTEVKLIGVTAVDPQGRSVTRIGCDRIELKACRVNQSGNRELTSDTDRTGESHQPNRGSRSRYRDPIIGGRVGVVDYAPVQNLSIRVEVPLLGVNASICLAQTPRRQGGFDVESRLGTSANLGRDDSVANMDVATEPAVADHA